MSITLRNFALVSILALGSCAALDEWAVDWESGPGPGPGPSQGVDPYTHAVVINDTALTPGEIHWIASQTGTQIPPGRYWYDGIAGTWGYEGGGAQGRAYPGVQLGGVLRRDISGGTTGIVINGRELPHSDLDLVPALRLVLPGHYTVTADGNMYLMNGAFVANLITVSGGNPKGSGGGSWSNTGIFGHTGGDGDTFYFIDGDSSYISG